MIKITMTCGVEGFPFPLVQSFENPDHSQFKTEKIRLELAI